MQTSNPTHFTPRRPRRKWNHFVPVWKRHIVTYVNDAAREFTVSCTKPRYNQTFCVA